MKDGKGKSVICKVLEAHLTAAYKSARDLPKEKGETEIKKKGS